jgi:NADH-quinone oxidoreductase subunit H
MNELLTKAGYTLISLFVITNYGLLLGGTMARVRAKVQGRIGQPVWQPYIDILKNNFKRTGVYHGVMFYLGPVFRLAGGLGTYLFIPAVYGSVVFSNFSFSGDVLLVMYFIFFGQFEVPFALSVISIAAQYQSLSITELVAVQQGGIANWIAVTNPLAMIAGMISFLGMSMGNPFSVVIAPQEIPIGPPTEMQSSFLGMLQTNRAIFNGAKLVLFMNLYFGGATNIGVMVIKTFLIYLYTVIVDASFPRFRTDQSIRFFLGIPTLVGIAAVVLQML